MHTDMFSEFKGLSEVEMDSWTFTLLTSDSKYGKIQLYGKIQNTQQCSLTPNRFIYIAYSPQGTDIVYCLEFT